MGACSSNPECDRRVSQPTVPKVLLGRGLRGLRIHSNDIIKKPVQVQPLTPEIIAEAETLVSLVVAGALARTLALEAHDSEMQATKIAVEAETVAKSDDGSIDNSAYWCGDGSIDASACW